MNSEIDQLKEEIFCLQYELKTMAEVSLFQKAERWVKGFVHQATEQAHLDRYEFATQFVNNKVVLDIACGSGYGSYLLRSKGNAENVVGVDLDKQAVRYGNHRFSDEKVKRLVDDATQFKYYNEFDVIVSFETIEHIPDYKKLLLNFSHNLKEDGILLISTPISKSTTLEPKNPYHVIEWSFNDFQQLVNSCGLEIKKIYLQNATIKKIGRSDLSLLKRIWFKLFPQKKKKFLKSLYSKQQGIYSYNNNPDEQITGGYQILVVKKIK